MWYPGSGVVHVLDLSILNHCRLSYFTARKSFSVTVLIRAFKVSMLWLRPLTVRVLSTRSPAHAQNMVVNTYTFA